MKNQDIQNIVDLYEEGIWDRMKAGASSIKGGSKNMKIFGGTGYSQGAQQAKGQSLMKSFANKVLKDIQIFESDIQKYTQSASYNQVLDKVNQIKQIIQSY